MLVEHNITERESPERSERWAVAQGANYTMATGHVEEYELTGHYEALRIRAEGLARTGGGSKALSLELRHTGGGFGRLRVTATHYAVGSENESEGGGSSGSGGGGSEEPGSSSSTPAVSVSFVRSEEDILSLPRFSAVVSVPQYAEALNLLRGGGRLSDYVYDEYAPQKRKTLRELFDNASGPLAEVLDLIMAGVHKYISVRPVVTVRHKVAGPTGGEHTAGVVASVPGYGYTPPDCNWLCVPGGVESDGKDWWATAAYECSGPGGWNQTVYGGQ